MRPLTHQEKRTIRLAGTLLAIYLALFYGVRAVKALEARRAQYHQLVQAAEKLKRELRPYENKALLIEELKSTYHLAPNKLSKLTLAADVSAAIQKTAAAGGVLLGPVR